MDTTSLLRQFHESGASDIHLSTGNPPMLRINGDMVALSLRTLTAEDVHGFLQSIMTASQTQEYKTHFELDFSATIGEDNRFRVNAYSTLLGPAAVLRGIAVHIHTLEELGVPESLIPLTTLHKGLILVTGPTGSGKSTTMSAFIQHINLRYSRHIITIEDPIEYTYTSAKSLINQREIGTHTASFSRALKSALREDPDVILVGEMRDVETIQLALTAAETGHLVIATLHTNSAAQTIDRIIDVFPADDKPLIRAMLANSLEAIVAQQLLKRSDNRGRVAAFELLLATPAIRNLIREGKVPQIFSTMQIASRIGMRVMKDSIAALRSDGIITEETARAFLNSTEGSNNFN